MRSLTLVLGAAVLVACSKPEAPPAAEPAPPAPPPAPAPINLADVAGNWTVKAMPEAGDSVLLTYTMHATAADTGWTVTFPGRKPLAMQVMTMGDSIMTTVAAYQSVLRKGQKVSTQGIMHLRDGKLVGTTIAHYATTKADSVARLRMVGTKVP